MRTVWSQDTYFSFLLWNLFLALIPLGISQILRTRTKTLRSSASFGLVVVWLLFFPNAPYLVTDLFHLYENQRVPLWLDTFMLFSFAWNGLVIAFISLRDIDSWLSAVCSHRSRQLLRVGLFTLTSFGLYLGRYLRWNSWDVFWRPGTVLRDIATTLFAPEMAVDLLAFLFICTLFLWINSRLFDQIVPEKTRRSSKKL